jgi:NADH-quinone oxidoreductase subunit M
MGFVTGGIFSLNQQGLDGAVMQMISHGIVSAALFSCVGIIYERLHTKQIKEMGGIAKTMPNFAILAMIFTMASVGLPGTSGFIGEFLSIVAIFQNSPIIATISALGVVLGASYMLLLYKNVWFGEIKNPAISKFNDLSTNEAFVLTIMAIATIVLGLYPKLLMQVFSLNTSNIANIFTNILTKH